MRNIIFLISVFVILLLSSTPVFPEEASIDKSENFEYNIPFSVVRQISLPKGYHEGICFDEGTLLVANGENKNTWRIDPDTGKKIEDIMPSGPFTEAVIKNDDGSYWVTDWKDKDLSRVVIEDGKMTDMMSISLAPSRPTGLTIIRGKLHVILWTRGMGTKYHLAEIDGNGEIINSVRINDISEPAHMVWDGRHLWMTSWYNYRVYKIDLDDLEILGSFRPGVKKTTGITFRNGRIWLTGTYEDLYEIEL